MNQKSQTGFAEFACNREPLFGTHGWRKCVFKINFTAASGRTWDPFGFDCSLHAITSPTRTQSLRSQVGVVAIMSMSEMSWRCNESERSNFAQAFRQDLS